MTKSLLTAVFPTASVGEEMDGPETDRHGGPPRAATSRPHCVRFAHLFDPDLVGSDNVMTKLPLLAQLRGSWVRVSRPLRAARSRRSSGLWSIDKVVQTARRFSCKLASRQCRVGRGAVGGQW